jgi:hypothetical protein
VIEWIEIDGPPMKGPIEEGFGTGFVKRSIEYELSGNASLQPGAAGLRWTVSFPVQSNVQPRAGHMTRGNGRHDDSGQVPERTTNPGGRG